MPRGTSEDAAQNKEEEAVSAITAKTLKEVTPTSEEREKTLRFADELEKKLGEKLKKTGISAEVSVQGSLAKDTWLAGNTDIDLFIVLPKELGREVFPKILEVSKTLTDKWVEAYAEHPYLQARVGEYKVDFVPCFKIERPEERASSVDRTPLHTAYVRSRLDERTRGEVRLFKKFAREMGVYGAEIRVKGLSGYLCELLIIHYGSFTEALRGIDSWRFSQIIDVEKHYGDRTDEARRLFDAPLVVIDPVDKGRNVAAAVSKEKLGELMMAAKLFLAKPSISFFKPDKTEPPSAPALKEHLSKLGFDLVSVHFKYGKAAPDVLWGQLYRTLDGLRGLLGQHDFQVIRSGVWSNEHETNVLIFELEAARIPSARKHIGPPVDSKDAAAFVEKHARGGATVTGPWVEEGRWVVCLRRRYVDAASLLRDTLESGGAEAGVAAGLAEDLKEADILVNGEILGLYASNGEFARFLFGFLRGKPRWMS